MAPPEKGEPPAAQEVSLYKQDVGLNSDQLMQWKRTRAERCCRSAASTKDCVIG